MARTRLSNAYFERQLATPATIRNWNTVRKLLGLVDGLDGPERR